MTADPPLILTLLLDAPTQARFDRERREHFPAALNRLGAHVTLFHHLPGDEADAVLGSVREAAAPALPCPVRVQGLRSLGRGVAYVLDAPGAAPVRAAVARRWRERLTAQDRQPWRPHVTIQNKATPEQARELLRRMQAGFVPFAATARGVALWRYLGGPWEIVAETPFGPGQGGGEH